MELGSGVKRQLGRQAGESPLLSSTIKKKKKNHPAADAVVINHAHICRKYLLLQPEMQNKSGDLLEGGGGGWIGK